MGLNIWSQSNSWAPAGRMMLVSYLIYFYLDINIRFGTNIIFLLSCKMKLAVESGINTLNKQKHKKQYIYYCATNYLMNFVFSNSDWNINPFPHIDAFRCLCSRRLLKTLWRKKKLLKASNFFIWHNVFNCIQKVCFHLGRFSIWLFVYTRNVPHDFGVGTCSKTINKEAWTVSLSRKSPRSCSPVRGKCFARVSSLLLVIQ